MLKCNKMIMVREDFCKYVVMLLINTIVTFYMKKEPKVLHLNMLKKYWIVPTEIGEVKIESESVVSCKT